MSAPKAKWISMPNALGIIRLETQLPDPEIEAALLAALADHEIRSQHTIVYETDIPGGSQPERRHQRDFGHRRISCVSIKTTKVSDACPCLRPMTTNVGTLRCTMMTY